MVSALGALAIVLAAFAYSQSGWPLTVLVGLMLHMGWHVLDGADGDLARMTGRNSPHGELVDGICDYIGHIVLYVTLGYIASTQIGPAGWALMWAAGASRVIQAAHYEGARRQYQLAVYGTPWMASEAPAANALGQRHLFVVYYLWLTGVIVPHSPALTAAAQEPAQREPLRNAMRAHARSFLPQMTLLSANYRTLAVGAAMFADRPHWYFLFEVLVLGGVMAISLRRVRSVFGAVLDHTASPSTRR